jgi:glycosyltransferase involved in cell wall biosynthesis
MRVGFVIYGSLDLVSGGFLYDRMLIEALRARGVSVEVVALPWRRWPWALAENVIAGVRGEWDVVVEDELVFPSVVARRHRQPVVALVHNLGGDGGLKTAVERRYLRRVAGVIAVCQDTLARVDGLVGHAVPAVVARAGRDHVVAPDREVVAGELRLLTTATVMPHKGLDRLLAALVPLSGWSLDVAGSLTADPAFASRMRAEVARRGWQDRVRLHGELERPALQALLSRADVFVLPSDREAYSLACLEALGFGLPVLVTDRGGMAEMITHGREGYLLSPEDIGAWTAALAPLHDRALLARLSRAARARFAQHGTWAETAALVDDFLRRFCCD